MTKISVLLEQKKKFLKYNIYISTGVFSLPTVCFPGEKENI